MRTLILAASIILAGGSAFCLENGGTVPEARAKKTVLEHVKNGVIKSEELEKESGKEIWSFDIETGGGIREVWVDAHTGEVIMDKAESAANEKAEAAKDRAERKAKAGKAKPAPRITKEQATKTALERAKGAVVKEAELEREKGRLVWSFDLEDAGKTREIQVSALTGKIVEDGIESPAAEKAEARADRPAAK